MSSGLLHSFLGALQASLAVLLTISYGAVASRFDLLKESSSRDISKTCVRLFLPALLITKVGSEVHADTAYRYAPVLSKFPRSPVTQSTLITFAVWALFYTLSSMALGWILKRAFKFPAWTVPAICFNNTTALPLLLIQSLETSGILGDLTMGESDTTSSAVRRAKSYFLVSSIVGNSLTFAIGPRLLDDEESPDKDTQKKEVLNRTGARSVDEEHTNPRNSDGRTAEQEEEHVTETTTLLPNFVARREDAVVAEISAQQEKLWIKLPMFARKTLSFLSNFLNGPLIGAILGAILGLVPPLHRAFFNEPSEGGIFKAWLTSSVSNIGELFAALQLVVVGAKLSGSLMKMKKGEASGSIPVIPMLSIFFIRFILWPA
jgi:predicted permease